MICFTNGNNGFVEGGGGDDDGSGQPQSTNLVLKIYSPFLIFVLNRKSFRRNTQRDKHAQI